MKYDTIFMYDTCTSDLYNYDIKNDVDFFISSIEISLSIS